MAIIDSEEGALRPVLVFSRLGLEDVQNDRYSIFVVVSDYSLIGVRSIGANDSVFSDRAFGRIVIGNYDPIRWL